MEVQLVAPCCCYCHCLILLLLLLLYQQGCYLKVAQGCTLQRP
jgi:hypothetical protein